MSAGADLRSTTEQNARHCFADISIDHREFWRWYYRDELRGQDAPASFPMIDANIAAKGFCARVGYEVSRKARKFFGEILRHRIPVAFLVATAAKHNATIVCGAHASPQKSQPRENLASHSETNATGGRS